jgi:hypothetical protein
MSDVTHLLQAIEHGDRKAAGESKNFRVRFGFRFKRSRARLEFPRGLGVRRQGEGVVAALGWEWNKLGRWQIWLAAETKAATSQTPSPQSKTLARSRTPSNCREVFDHGCLLVFRLHSRRGLC